MRDWIVPGARNLLLVLVQLVKAQLKRKKKFRYCYINKRSQAN